jgi:deoxyadenosine/deoxycytidine kinase
MVDLDRLDAVRQGARNTSFKTTDNAALDYLEALHNAYPLLAAELRELRFRVDALEAWMNPQDVCDAINEARKGGK